MLRTRWALFAVVAALVAAVVACGGDDDSGTATPATSSGGPTGAANGSPTGTPRPIVPPLEGPPRRGGITELHNFREDPEWSMPDPADVPAPDEDADDPVLNPPEPSCPDGWTKLDRPVEGFSICHPEDWPEAGHGYVSSANEDRWYSLGIFQFTDESREHQRAHVSVYVFPAEAEPVRLILDCPQPFSVTFAGEPAVVCPEFPPQPPEARVVSYHVLREQYDYFVNVVAYNEFDEESGEYTDEVAEDAFETALQIANSFEFTPITPQQ